MSLNQPGHQPSRPILIVLPIVLPIALLLSVGLPSCSSQNEVVQPDSSPLTSPAQSSPSSDFSEPEPLADSSNKLVPSALSQPAVKPPIVERVPSEQTAELETLNAEPATSQPSSLPRSPEPNLAEPNLAEPEEIAPMLLPTPIPAPDVVAPEPRPPAPYVIDQPPEAQPTDIPTPPDAAQNLQPQSGESEALTPEPALPLPDEIQAVPQPVAPQPNSESPR
jgi:hypothetical protein